MQIAHLILTRPSAASYPEAYKSFPYSNPGEMVGYIKNYKQIKIETGGNQPFAELLFCIRKNRPKIFLKNPTIKGPVPKKCLPVSALTKISYF